MHGMVLSCVAPSCWLELLDKLQKRVYRNIGPSLSASLEPVAHLRNVASLSLFHMYYFGIHIHLNWLNWFQFLIILRGLLFILHDISVTIPRCYNIVYVNSFFLRTARLWNFPSIECYPLLYDLNGFKSRI